MEIKPHPIKRTKKNNEFNNKQIMQFDLRFWNFEFLDKSEKKTQIKRFDRFTDGFDGLVIANIYINAKAFRYILIKRVKHLIKIYCVVFIFSVKT